MLRPNSTVVTATTYWPQEIIQWASTTHEIPGEVHIRRVFKQKGGVVFHLYGGNTEEFIRTVGSSYPHVLTITVDHRGWPAITHNGRPYQYELRLACAPLFGKICRELKEACERNIEIRRINRMKHSKGMLVHLSGYSREQVERFLDSLKQGEYTIQKDGHSVTRSGKRFDFRRID